MAKQNRRKFLAIAGALSSGMVASSIPVIMREDKKQVIHHVFFWLKNPSSKPDLERLLQGLKTLKGIETVRKIYIGIPAATEHRNVVDVSYNASELIFFDDLSGQKIYQEHPIHKKFVEDCAHLWEKVVVYDVTDI